MDKTLGQRAADFVAATVGSWPFLIIQTFLLGVWVYMNVDPDFHHWDVYPFILLNLMLSFQAAYTGPIVMISQNRQEEIQRQTIEEIKAVGMATKTIAEATKDMLGDHTEMLQQLTGHIEK